MAKRSRNSEQASASDDEDETDSPFPFPTTRDDDTFASIDLDTPPTEATPETDAADPSDTPPPQSNEQPATGPQPVARVTVDPPDGQTRTLEFTPPRFVIGRTEADLVVDDPFLSTWHAQLFLDGDTLVLQDMNSYNGVFLRIADELLLEDRDELTMGQQRFVFRTQWDEPESADRPDLKIPRLGAPIAGSPVRLFRMLAGERVGGMYELGDRLTIGGDGCGVACPEDLSLSNPHAEIVRQGDSFLLRDLDSEFGTFIRIHDAVEVVDGDCFMAGRTRLDVTYL